MRRILLVGQRANGKCLRRPRNRALENNVRFLRRLGAFKSGPSRQKLIALGLTWDEAVNLLPQRPTSLDTWLARDKAVAKRNAKAIMDYAQANDMDIVLLGNRVAEAFGLKYEPGRVMSILAYKTSESRITANDVIRGRKKAKKHLGDILILPHPSGRNRYWNDENNVSRTVSTITRFLVGRKK